MLCHATNLPDSESGSKANSARDKAKEVLADFQELRMNDRKDRGAAPRHMFPATRGQGFALSAGTNGPLVAPCCVTFCVGPGPISWKDECP